MKISTRGRYAVRIVLDVAMHGQDGYVTMKDISRRQQISKKYGDQIALQLTQSGILLAARGRQGGYRLMTDPSQMTVLQVLNAMEGSLAPVQCLETRPNYCERCNYCLTLPVWQGLDDAIQNYLGGITMQSLMENAKPQPDLEDLPIMD